MTLSYQSSCMVLTVGLALNPFSPYEYIYHISTAQSSKWPNTVVGFHGFTVPQTIQFMERGTQNPTICVLGPSE